MWVFLQLTDVLFKILFHVSCFQISPYVTSQMYCSCACNIVVPICSSPAKECPSKSFRKSIQQSHWERVSIKVIEKEFYYMFKHDMTKLMINECLDYICYLIHLCENIKLCRNYFFMVFKKVHFQDHVNSEIVIQYTQVHYLECWQLYPYGSADQPNPTWVPHKY